MHATYPDFVDSISTQPAPLDAPRHPRIPRAPRDTMRERMQEQTTEPRGITAGAWLFGIGIVALAVLVFACIGVASVLR